MIINARFNDYSSTLIHLYYPHLPRSLSYATEHWATISLQGVKKKTRELDLSRSRNIHVCVLKLLPQSLALIPCQNITDRTFTFFFLKKYIPKTL